MVLNLWKYRRLILRNAINDLRNRYRGSVAGYLWNIFVPLAQIIVFATIFSVLMQARLPRMPGMEDRFNFVIFLCAGLLPWNAFADTLSRGVSSLAGNAGYLKKLPVPEQFFVAQDTCSGFFSGLIAIALFMLFSIIFAGYGPRAQWIQVIPALVLFMGFAFGLGLFLSCLNVFFRDIQPLMGVIILLWFWLTPVVYVETMFVDTQHEWVLSLLPLNPAYHFVHAFQDAVYRSTWVAPGVWATCLAITLAVNAIAYLVLRRLRADIRDTL